MDFPEDGDSFVFDVRWQLPTLREDFGEAEFAAYPDCPAAAGLSGFLKAEVHSFLPGGSQILDGVGKGISVVCHLAQRRFDRAIGAAADLLDELPTDLRDRVDLTLRFHVPGERSPVTFHTTGRVSAALADTDRAVEWDDLYVRPPGSPEPRRAVLTLSLPPIPG